MSINNTVSAECKKHTIVAGMANLTHLDVSNVPGISYATLLSSHDDTLQLIIEADNDEAHARFLAEAMKLIKLHGRNSKIIDRASGRRVDLRKSMHSTSVKTPFE